MDEVIQPRNKALSKVEREKGRLKFWKRYGAWYAFNYKRNGTKSWIDKFDRQNNQDKQGW